MRECQNCTHQVDGEWTLCQTCRRQYAKTLHSLRHDMLLLQSVSRREYKLAETSVGSGGNPGDSAPAPLILHGYDLLAEAEDMLQSAWADTGAVWSDTWQKLIPRMLAHMADLCKAPHAGRYLRLVARYDLRIQPLVDRKPRRRRIIGICPADGCDAEITAAPGETWRICEQCGALVNIPALRTDMGEQVDRYHLTRTPAGLAEWLRHEYGYEISRKQVSNWINRGKLPSTKPVADGYYEFSIREVLAMAMGSRND